MSWLLGMARGPSCVYRRWRKGYVCCGRRVVAARMRIRNLFEQDAAEHAHGRIGNGLLTGVPSRVHRGCRKGHVCRVNSRSAYFWIRRDPSLAGVCSVGGGALEWQ